MGFQTEFNWIVKLKPEQGLDEENLKVDEVYEFAKEDNRVYPINIPIDLVNKDWEAVARVVVLEFTNKEKATSGKYKVLRIYEGQEKEILTKLWRENLTHVTGQTDPTDAKMT